ncbi:MAG: ABC transporter ATP-binding protein [Actinomycetota bacterium]|jgi:ABC-2 type transport system ATP-binding protein|nr:ABC transporter ATP-binding protein [Actinomycetota bacterium]
MANVSKRYRGGGGVEGVTLDIWPGEVFGFLGPNGAGKTTTIRLLLDLIRPDRGTITLVGLDSRRDSVAARRRIGYLPGELALYDRMTPRELLTHFAYLRGGPPWSEIDRLAAQFTLELDRPIRELSKGNRQKVGLVQALMGRPEVLVLDEPTSGLDPIVQHQVHRAIRDAADGGRTVFLSSHVLSEVAQVADRVGLIRDGRVIAVERVQDLRGRAAHVVDARFAAPLPPGAFAGLPGVEGRQVAGDTLHLEVTGALAPVVGELARFDVVDLTVREPDLEELFLAFYESADAAA